MHQKKEPVSWEMPLDVAERFQSIQKIYEKYYDSGEDVLFTELIEQTDRLWAGVVRKNLRLNGCLNEDTEHIAMQEARTAVWEYIQACRESGKKNEMFARYCKGIYYHKCMDVVRKQTTYNKRYQNPVSLEAPVSDTGKTWKDGLENPENKPEQDDSSRTVQKLYDRLFLLYCRSLVDADAEPARELALYYARILPHVLQIIFEVQTIPDSKTASAKWAYERMGTQTAGSLGSISEREMKALIHDSLCWCESFWQRMETKVSTLSGKIQLKNAVYTALYGKKKIEDWSESMHKTLTKATMKAVMKDPELKKTAVAYISEKNKIYCLVRGGEKG